MGLFDLFKRSKADKNNSRETATDNSATFLKSDNNTSADQSEFNITEEILKVISGGTSYMNAEAEKKNLDDPEYGLVPEKPVYTKGISGSKIYLSSLLTDTGKEINWERAGSQEVPGINGPVDIYVGTGYSQSGKKTVYVNMYGTNNSVFSPRGFRFKHENLPEKKVKKEMEIISFGTYAGEKIEWKIVHKEDGKALLFSKYGLDAKSYHDNKDENVSWENCSLRKWLNQDFYKSAFNQHEKDCIIEASVDKVFLLSLNDIEKYFGYNVHIRDRKYRHEDLVIVPTPYALSKGAYVVSQEAVRQYEKRSFIYPKWYQLNNDDIGSGWCWLKDCGDKPGTAALIDFGGVIAFWGDGVTETMGCVCPALWIDLNRYKNIVNKSGEANTSQKNIMKEQQIDPYDAPDLLSHRNDPNNMRLGFQSEGFYGGHAGTEIIYYAALRQVIVHKYSKSDKNGYKSSVDRIPIPENISSKKEMQTYVKICNSTCSDLITDDLGNSNHIILDGISYETSGPCGYIFRNQCQEVAEVDINLPYDSKIFFQGYRQYLRCEAFNSNMTLRPGNCIYMTDQDNNYYGTFEIPDFQHMYIHVNGKIISVVKDVKSWKFFLDGYMVASIFRLSEAAKIEYSSELSGKGDSERQLSVKIVKNLDAVWHPMILVTPILGF